MNLNRELYTVATMEHASQVISERRELLVLDYSRELPGRRFFSTHYVLAVLESFSPESQFESDPIGTVDRALRDAAKADFWYENESQFQIDDALEDYDDDND